MTWTGHLYSTAVQVPVVKWLVCMQGELLYQNINLRKKSKGFVGQQSYPVITASSGLSWGFWKQEWVGIRTSVQAMSVSPCRGAPVHTDTQDVAQCLGEKLVWTTKPCAFCFLSAEETVFQPVQELTWFLLEQTPGWCVLLCREVLVICSENKPPENSWVLGKDLNPFLSQ